MADASKSGWAAQSGGVRAIELVFLAVAVVGTSFAIANAWTHPARRSRRRLAK